VFEDAKQKPEELAEDECLPRLSKDQNFEWEENVD
jgi:hypothetical protein